MVFRHDYCVILLKVLHLQVYNAYKHNFVSICNLFGKQNNAKNYFFQNLNQSSKLLFSTNHLKIATFWRKRHLALNLQHRLYLCTDTFLLTKWQLCVEETIKNEPRASFMKTPFRQIKSTTTLSSCDAVRISGAAATGYLLW